MASPVNAITIGLGLSLAGLAMLVAAFTIPDYLLFELGALIFLAGLIPVSVGWLRRQARNGPNRRAE